MSDIDVSQVQVVKVSPKRTSAEDNADTIRQQARTALVDNKAYVASTPSNAQIAAQVKALTRQNNGIIRLLLNNLESTD